MSAKDRVLPGAGDAGTLSGDDTIELVEFDAPPPDPLELLAAWLASADAHGVREPRALTVATVDARGVPATRVVLLKSVSAEGLLFTTHTGGRKGRHLAERPVAAGTLYWRETLQQINVAGPVVAVPADEADRLFDDRPLDARATTAASRQSELLDDEEALHRRAEELAARPDTLRRPETWGGYRIVPDVVEFWQGRRTRLHRRLEYRREGSGAWTARRLQP